MNIWHDIKPEQIRKDAYTAVVTNTQGSTAGLAFDGDTGLLRLEYLSDTGMGVPFNTAMIPRTCTPTGAPIESILQSSDSADDLGGMPSGRSGAGASDQRKTACAAAVRGGCG